MIVGFKVTQSCAEPRVVQEWNLITDISPEKLNIILLWSYGSSHLQKHLSFQPLIPLRVSSFFAPNSACWLKLLFHYGVLLLLTGMSELYLYIYTHIYTLYIHTHIHPIAHLRFPIYWLTLGRKFSEGTLVITCPTSTDFQNYHYHFFPSIEIN